MSQKRQQEDLDARPPRLEGFDASSDDKRRKVPLLRDVVLEIMKLRTLQHLMEPVLEPFIRRVVKEEVELALSKYLTSMEWNHEKETHALESRILQLQFLNAISLPVFTGSPIEGEDYTSLRLGLFDALTGQVISTGPESSAKVEIVVLEGEFDGDKGDDWTLEEFKNNIVKEREGKKAILTGNAFLYLDNGIGLVGDISFTDNSSWTRSRQFKMGARVVDGCNGIRVREAKTESFIVRDDRGESYKKHHPPSPGDEVWRLEKIGRDGAFHKRLNKQKVVTVKDFLTLLFTDPTRLRNILGAGMSSKMWEATADHARTCVLDTTLYLYSPPGCQQKTCVVFNIVGQVIGLCSDSQYIPINKLSETEKAAATGLVISAFTHWEKVFSFEDEAFAAHYSSHLSNLHYPSTSTPLAETSDGTSPSTSQKLGRFDYPEASLSPSDIIYDDNGFTNIDSTDVRFEQPIGFQTQVMNSMIPSFCEDERLQCFDTDCSFLQNTCLKPEAGLENGFVSAAIAIDKAQRRWTMVFCVLRWFSVRRIVARKSNLGQCKNIETKNG